jgi:hypothetical protein
VDELQQAAGLHNSLTGRWLWACDSKFPIRSLDRKQKGAVISGRFLQGSAAGRRGNQADSNLGTGGISNKDRCGLLSRVPWAKLIDAYLTKLLIDVYRLWPARPVPHYETDKKNQVNLLLGCMNLGASEIWGPCSVEHLEPVGLFVTL